MYFAQDAGALGAIKGGSGHQAEELLNKVDARYRSSDGEWIGITGRVRTVDYNTI